MKKKIITMLLALLLAVSAAIVPAWAASPNGGWPGYFSVWKSWIAQFQAKDEGDGESETPEESETAEKSEAPEETESAPESEEPAQEEYTIRYDANGGYFWSQYASPSIAATKSYTVSDGNTHKVISSPTYTGHPFYGWADQYGNLYQPGDLITPTESMTLKASWGGFSL